MCFLSQHWCYFPTLSEGDRFSRQKSETKKEAGEEIQNVEHSCFYRPPNILGNQIKYIPRILFKIGNMIWSINCFSMYSFKHINESVISGFRWDVDEICALLGCYAAEHPRRAHISMFCVHRSCIFYLLPYLGQTFAGRKDNSYTEFWPVVFLYNLYMSLV
jgi:hypothetical protein